MDEPALNTHPVQSAVLLLVSSVYTITLSICIPKTNTSISTTFYFHFRFLFSLFIASNRLLSLVLAFNLVHHSAVLLLLEALLEEHLVLDRQKLPVWVVFAARQDGLTWSGHVLHRLP